MTAIDNEIRESILNALDENKTSYAIFGKMMALSNDIERTFKGPGQTEVYVPPKPPPHPDDIKRDFPSGSPPVVRYMDVAGNYWSILREGKMAYMGGEKVFSSEVIEWLRSIEPQVEVLLFK